jgi:heme o synthase
LSSADTAVPVAARNATGTASLLTTAGAYVALTKPRIIELLLVTTVPPMVLAAAGWPGTGLVVAVLIGGTLTAGAANALNMVLDRDIDAVMARTRGRPIPAGTVTPGSATVFALVIAALGIGLLWSVAGQVAALLAAGAIVYYVGVYTAWLKRRTDQNIVIGGAAGAAPVLIGWAAVTGGLAAPAWVLFAVVFLWTPPHFWALAIVCNDDYNRAGVPMLPVVRGLAATGRSSRRYAIATVATSLLLPVTAPTVGPVYGLCALVLGAWFIERSVAMEQEPRPRVARTLFTASIGYLALLFAALVVDQLLPGF